MDEYLLIICIISFILISYTFFLLKKSFSPAALYDLAMDEYSQSEYRVAYILLKKAIKMKPKYTAAIQLLGLTSLKLHDYASAENCFIQILKIEPDRMEALYNLALTYQMSGKKQDAKDYYYKALTVDDKDRDTLYNLGLLLYELEEYKDAIETFEKVVKIEPNKAITKFYIAKCKDKMHDLPQYESENSAEEIIELYSTLEGKEDLPPDYSITLATAFAKTGNINKAEEYCQKAIFNVDDDIRSYKLQAVICLVKKDLDCAKNNLHIAMQLNPNDEEVYNLLKYV